MEVLVVDDEPLARDRLVRMVEKLDGYRVCGEAGNTLEALAALARTDPDVVLLDVHMPGEDGLSAARQIAALEDPPAVIFCTAYDRYALDAFDTEAVGYLLKPVKLQLLSQALAKAQKVNKVQLAALQQRAGRAESDAEGEQVAQERTHISVKTRHGVELIALAQVRYFCADQKYVTVYHTEGETLIDDTLKGLEREFGERFLRIHRNALVSVAHIEGLEKNQQGHYQLRLQGLTQRPVVSRRHLAKVRDFLVHA